MFLATAGRAAALALSGAVLSLSPLAASSIDRGPFPPPFEGDLYLIADDEPGYLGVTLTEDEGLFVAEVIPGTPAEKYGLRIGDRILMGAGKKVESLDGLLEILADHPAGSKITLVVLRGEEKEKVKLVLGSRDQPKLEKVVEEIVVESSDPEFGGHEDALRAVLAELEGQKKKQKKSPAPADGKSGFLGVTLEGDAAVVDQVLPGTAAEKAKLRAGDRIVAVGDRKIQSADQLIDALSSRTAGTGVLLVVERDGDFLKVKTKLGAREGGGKTEGLPPATGFSHEEKKDGVSDQEKALHDILAELDRKKEHAHEEIEIQKIVGGDSPGFLGVTLKDEDGLYVLEVLPGTAAEQAKLQSGDQILAVDDHRIGGLGDLQKALATRPAGTKAIFVVARDGKKVKTKAVLGTRDGEKKMLLPGAEAQDLFVIKEEPKKRNAKAPKTEGPEGPGFLGVTLEDADGLFVDEVLPGTAAEKAKLQSGDRILAVDDHRIGNLTDLQKALSTRPAGTKIGLVVARDGEKVKTKALLGTRDGEKKVMVPDADNHGIFVTTEAPPQKKAQEKAKEKAKKAKRPGFLGVYLSGEPGGPIISGVIPGTAAEKAGLMEGDWLLAVNGHETATDEAARKAIASIGAGNKAELEVMRGEKSLRLKVKLGEPEEEVEDLFFGADEPFGNVEIGELREHEGDLDEVMRVLHERLGGDGGRLVEIEEIEIPEMPRLREIHFEGLPHAAKDVDLDELRSGLKDLRHEVQGLRKELQELRKALRDMR